LRRDKAEQLLPGRREKIERREEAPKAEEGGGLRTGESWITKDDGKQAVRTNPQNPGKRDREGNQHTEAQRGS
jgi:hypothetical protein